MYHLKVDCILMEIYWSKLLEKLFEFWHVLRPQTASEAIEVTATQLINHGQRPLTNFHHPRLYGVVIN